MYTAVHTLIAISILLSLPVTAQAQAPAVPSELIDELAPPVNRPSAFSRVMACRDGSDDCDLDGLARQIFAFNPVTERLVYGVSGGDCVESEQLEVAVARLSDGAVVNTVPFLLATGCEDSPDEDLCYEAYRDAGWSYVAALIAEGYQEGTNLVVLVAEQFFGIRSHRPLVVLGDPLSDYQLYAVRQRDQLEYWLYGPEQSFSVQIASAPLVSARCYDDEECGNYDGVIINRVHLLERESGYWLLVDVGLTDGGHCTGTLREFHYVALPDEAVPIAAPSSAPTAP